MAWQCLANDPIDFAGCQQLVAGKVSVARFVGVGTEPQEPLRRFRRGRVFVGRFKPLAWIDGQQIEMPGAPASLARICRGEFGGQLGADGLPSSACSPSVSGGRSSSRIRRIQKPDSSLHGPRVNQNRQRFFRVSFAMIEIPCGVVVRYSGSLAKPSSRQSRRKLFAACRSVARLGFSRRIENLSAVNVPLAAMSARAASIRSNMAQGGP